MQHVSSQASSKAGDSAKDEPEAEPQVTDGKATRVRCEMSMGSIMHGPVYGSGCVPFARADA